MACPAPGCGGTGRGGPALALIASLAAAAVLLLAGTADAGQRSPGPGKPGAGKPGAAKPGPAPPGFFGVSGRWATSGDFETMGAVGTGAYRTLFHFRATRRRPNEFYDWSAFDRLVGEAARNGVTLLPLLYGTPDWIATDETQPPTRSPDAITEWRQLLIQVVSRYGRGGLFWGLNPFVPYRPVTAWQIWNEPNDPTFWEGGASPEEFASLLRISAHAIRSVDPEAKIVSGGIVARPTGLGGVAGRHFLRRVLRKPGAAEAIDAIGYHPYAKTARGSLRHIRQARRTINRQKVGRPPIWVTEIGWSSRRGLGGIFFKGEVGQARALRMTFRTIQRHRERLGVDRVLWYYWRDQWDPFCLWCRSAGLLSNDFRSKRALIEFDRLAR